MTSPAALPCPPLTATPPPPEGVACGRTGKVQLKATEVSLGNVLDLVLQAPSSKGG